MADLRRVGALWKKTGKSGTFYSGTLDANAVKLALGSGETRLLLFPVKKKSERGPDIELFCAADARRQDTPSERPAVPSVPRDDEDAIPF
jgi:hypothetical protein